jgi:hypothetical protein
MKRASAGAAKTKIHFIVKPIAIRASSSEHRQQPAEDVNA